MSTTNAPSSIAPHIHPDSSRAVPRVAFFVISAIILALILTTATGVMDLPAMMGDLFPPATTPPPFAPSAS